jgi:Fe-S cluster biogenesis protein NfuA
MAATGRVNVFSRVRPGVAREDGDQHCVEMNPDEKKCVVRLQGGAVQVESG